MSDDDVDEVVLLFGCPDRRCSRVFENEHDAQRHMAEHRAQHEENNQESLTRSLREKLCNVRTTDRWGLQSVKFPLPEGARHSPQALPSTSRDVRDVRKCTLCPFDTFDATEMQRHALRHSIVEGIACRYCSYNARDDCDLTLHTSLHFKPTHYQTSMMNEASAFTPTWNTLRWFLSQHPPLSVPIKGP